MPRRRRHLQRSRPSARTRQSRSERPRHRALRGPTDRYARATTSCLLATMSASCRQSPSPRYLSPRSPRRFQARAQKFLTLGHACGVVKNGGIATHAVKHAVLAEPMSNPNKIPVNTTHAEDMRDARQHTVYLPPSLGDPPAATPTSYRRRRQSLPRAPQLWPKATPPLPPSWPAR